MMHNNGSTGGATAIAATPLNRGPQPGWMTLNDARDRAFTGEIVFEVEPEVRVYVDNGGAYFAERSTDAPLAQRLLQAGIVDQGQLERGTVRVGDVEHLGRLFDRDATVDRDAVMVVTETETQVIVAEIANEVICTVRSTAYRHHPSGLHRWFATPLDAADRSFGVSSLETSVIEDIPGLPIVTERTLADQLYIEWDEPIIGGPRVAADETLIEEFDDSMLQAMLDESAMQHDIIEFDEVAEIDLATEITTVEIDYLVTDDLHPDELRLDEWAMEDFDTASIETAVGFAVPVFESPLMAQDMGCRTADEFLVVWPTGADDGTAMPELETMDGSLQSDADSIDVLGTAELQSTDDLAMTPIETWDEEIVAEVPTEVADAVKRAIAALERITGEVPVVGPIKQPSEFDEPNAGMPILAAAPAFSGFAPPSLDMSAEAMYARATAQIQAEMEAATSGSVGFDDTPDADGATVDQAAAAEPAAHLAAVAEHAVPTAGVASVVFVDDVAPGDPGDGANDRSSALRRLISGLRRKDR